MRTDDEAKVVSIGQVGGITAHTVHVHGPVKRSITPEQRLQFLAVATCPKEFANYSVPIRRESVSEESEVYTNTLSKLLGEAGWIPVAQHHMTNTLGSFNGLIIEVSNLREPHPAAEILRNGFNQAGIEHSFVRGPWDSTTQHFRLVVGSAI